MRVRVLGSAAGGGFPQWNCGCPVCQAGREGRAAARTQSSIAVRSGGGPWLLLNASPDVHRQLAVLPGAAPAAMRATPIAGVVLTDGEVDHTTGLVLLREAGEPLRVYCSEAVRAALTGPYPVLRVLDHYCGVDWQELREAQRITVPEARLEIEPFATGGDAPLYAGGADGPSSVGLMIRDMTDDRVLCYAPALATVGEDILERMRASDCVLADGTFWRADELVSLGLSERDSWTMGHAPLSGEGGTLAALAQLAARTVLVHINNSNPILLEQSNERAAVEQLGIEVGFDGLEFDV